MNTYTVELTSPAKREYAGIHEAASGGKSSPTKLDVLRVVDALLDALTECEFEHSLSSPFSNVYWIAEGSVRIFYARSPARPRVIVVTRISTTPRPITSFERAEAIIRHMAYAGHLNHLLVQAGIQLRRIPPIN